MTSASKAKAAKAAMTTVSDLNVEDDVNWGPEVFVHIQKLYRCEHFGICEWNAGNLEQQNEHLEIHNNALTSILVLVVNTIKMPYSNRDTYIVN